MSGSNPLQRGPSPKKDQQSDSAPSKPKKIITVGESDQTKPKKKIITVGGNKQARASMNQDFEASPWLNPSEPPAPDPTASFVEYLRWMRSPDSPYKDPTKVQILQLAEERAEYSVRLNEMTRRTRLIAGQENCFEVACPWRIRVGGHRGPESILLPAFDAVGMPYIPSSTLRGVTRTQAIREFMASDGCAWKDAEKKIAPWFGSLDEKGSDRTGKVVFLDAYPLAMGEALGGGVKADIATHIWEWNDDAQQYSEPNPNPFISLSQPKFLIGLKLVSGYSSKECLNRVRNWLINGLKNGVGSQVNTGYGELLLGNSSSETRTNEFFRVTFSLEGQLVHGQQKFKHDFRKDLAPNLKKLYKTDRDGNLKRDKKEKLQSDSIAHNEVRPTAFKSMLRYWFRTLALGVLDAAIVKENLEPHLFGSIEPTYRQWGWVKVNIEDGSVFVEEPKDRNAQEGILILSLSPSKSLGEEKRVWVETLITDLTWLMFHLGGVGQGARRPCYSRKRGQNSRPPLFRGACLESLDEDCFWDLPEDLRAFRELFRKRLLSFYKVLGQLAEVDNLHLEKKSVGTVTSRQWYEAVDQNCKIIVCSGKEEFQKPYALSTLHDDNLKKRERDNKLSYDPNLCGVASRQDVRPSPVWISNLQERYQVVTVFGANQSPREDFLALLENRSEQYFPVWPFA